MSAAGNAKDLRKHIRYKSGPDQESNLPGDIFSATEKRKISYIIKDYSVEGLGIITKDKLLPELNFVLILPSANGEPNGTITLSIVWGMSCNDGSGSFRYGLKVTGGDKSMSEIFSIPG